MAIIDTHNHLYFSGFKNTLDLELQASQNNGVEQQILIGIDELSCQAALNLARQHSTFKVALGLHPCDVDALSQYEPEHHQYVGLKSHLRPEIKNHQAYFEWIEKLATQNPKTVVAFGETGFDQYHRQSEHLLKLQTECFEQHLHLCQKHQKTLIIHSRGARDITVNFLHQNAQTFKHIKFVWHCFTEDTKAAQLVFELGGFIGVGGVATYPKSTELQSLITQAPLEQIVTETDAPFLTPHQARKAKAKLNGPQFLPEVITKISELKALPLDQIEKQLHQNALTAFPDLKSN